MAIIIPGDRLDASESRFFSRQLESVSTTVYAKLYPENRGRSLVPLITDCAESAPVYTWRMIERFGTAKFISAMSDDAPRVDVNGLESSTIIKNLGDSYGYDVLEIQNAMRVGVDLSNERAMAARDAVEDLLDLTLATGDALQGLKGLLNLANTNTATLATAAANPASKAWTYKTADEIVADVANMILTQVNALQQNAAPDWSKFSLVIPVGAHIAITTRRMGDGASETIYSYLMSKVGEYITECVPWRRCTNAGSGGAIDRAALYVKRPEVVGGLIPMEFKQHPPQARNFTFVVPCMARTGGVISRYPIGVTYADGL